ncbi:MAG: hypothetical protein M3N54_10465 [Acidobacteriota bacterium]|nr:hypothetical protein [Acidobacteriota bacterium]
MKRLLVLCLVIPALRGQEASSGFELRATLSGMAAASSRFTQDPRSGSPVDAGFRSVFYPVWKVSEHWTVSGAYQVNSRPYFAESFSTQGHGVKGSILQATVNYSRTSGDRSILIRVGQLTTAFGSFPLHYDDADNALVDLPLEYGYYYAAISTLSLAGAQIDATAGKWDGRLQLSNSSPANPRSIFARDQYGNWTAGGGYSILQGFRVGLSAQRGPYLDRQFAFYFPGEAKPSELPASSIGVDAQFARGHWNLQGEWQRFVRPYKAIPTFRERGGYFEIKRTLHPRLYVAARAGYLSAGAFGIRRTFETVAGFRPNGIQLLKVSYEYEWASQGEYRKENTVALQLVTSLRPLSFARK